MISHTDTTIDCSINHGLKESYSKLKEESKRNSGEMLKLMSMAYQYMGLGKMENLAGVNFPKNFYYQIIKVYS
jgi:hypothetical protein